MNKGQFRVAKRTQKDYTLAFKLQVVVEVESGQFSQKPFAASMVFRQAVQF